MPNLLILIKQEYTTSQKRSSRNFCRITNRVLKTVNLLYLLYLTTPKVLSSASDKNSLLETFLRTPILNTKIYIYSRLPVIWTTTGNKNLLQISEVSNNWKSTLMWPISNYYQFFTELGYKKVYWKKMLCKSFPCRITKSLKFFEKIVHFRLLFCS